MKRIRFLLPLLLILTLFVTSVILSQTKETTGGRCITCHKEITPGLYKQWYESAHAESGITCLDCHGANRNNTDAFLHNDAYIATMVTPNDCGSCHEKEMKHVENSYHATAGEDYSAAPTCATCHMSATKKQEFTHDVGQRIAWTLRPIRSEYKENWQEKRANMKEVCSTCHGSAFINGHFYQFDAVIRLYNEKFAKPSTEIMNLIKKNNILTNKANFGNKIEWTYWELWHHEGRRARQGVSMMGPDYTWWHGFYEVAQNFYFKFIPEAREYNNPDVNSFVDNLLLRDTMHQWLHRSPDELKNDIRSEKLQQIYKNLFNEVKQIIQG